MNKILLTSLFLVQSFVFGTLAIAVDYETLVQNYKAALATDDQAQITSAWKAIAADSKTVAYLEVHYPLLASSYRLKGITLKLGQDLEEYQKNYPRLLTSPEPDAATSSAPPLDNDQAALIHPNQDQRSNQEIVKELPNQNLPDNGTLTKGHPNQNEISNQDLINNRLKRMSPNNEQH